VNLRLVVRFGLVLFGGVVLVWIFGVDPDEGLLGKKQERIAVADAERLRAEREGDPSTDAESDVALTDATIPVRAELDDEPGVMVLKYVIHIGRTESAGAKKMPAEKVRIDIYNKKPRPDERVIARVNGDLGTLHFATAPDAAAGFRDAQVDSMLLAGNVVVNYLDESGATATTMLSDDLDLSESAFEVTGRARIEQEGMTIEGTHLLYSKKDGSFSLERDVTVFGTRFGLPDLEIKGGQEEPADAAPATAKTIRCDGSFTYVPAEETGDSAASNDAGSLASIGGGLLMFRENVRGSQGESNLSCDLLELTLENAPSTIVEGPDGPIEKKGALDVTNVLATGSPTKPATLVNPQGTLVGETLHLVKTDAGQVVTLDGRPEIRDALFGGSSDESGDSSPATSFSAGAKSRIIVRPKPTDQTDPSDSDEDGDGEAAVTATVLELREDAFLETHSEEEGKAFRIEGHALDLDFVERVIPVPADVAGAPGETEKKEMELERLFATGDARGIFSGGTFFGDEIVAIPIEGADGASNFDISVSPNPRVTLKEAAAAERLETEITIESENGKLTYTPPADPSQPTRATFHAVDEPVTLRVVEGEKLTTQLDAHETIVIDLAAAGSDSSDALQSLVATGDVHFQSIDQGVTGDGDRLTLLPAGEGKRKFLLEGELATAKMNDETSGRREVDARSIEFDPETGALHAIGDVEATIAGLAISGETGASSTSSKDASKDPGVLHCHEMTLNTRDDGTVMLEAWGDVRFEEPARDLVATAQRLVYDQKTGLATLYGTYRDPARVTRSSAAQGATPPKTVAVAGPLILLEQESGVMTCPARGVVFLIRPAFEGQSEVKVTARSQGPVRYVEDRLVLRDDVVVGFEEAGSETRALWSDVCTVFFAPAPPPGEEAAGETVSNEAETTSDTAGLDRIVAEGRVHLEQTAPRELIAEGERLEWTLSENDEEIFLSGRNPQCWVIGLLGDKDVRDEADWFRMRNGSNEVEAENGRTVFVGEVSGN